MSATGVDEAADRLRTCVASIEGGPTLDGALACFEQMVVERLEPPEGLVIIDDMLQFDASVDGPRFAVVLTRQLIYETDGGGQHDTFVISVVLDYPPDLASAPGVFWERSDDAGAFTRRLRSTRGFQQLRAVQARVAEVVAEPV